MYARSAVLLLLTAGAACAADGGTLSRTVLRGMPANCSPEGLCLSVTVGAADPANAAACPDGSSLNAAVGDAIGWCYTLTNTGSQALAWHSISDSLHGVVLSQRAQAIPPGESWSYVLAERAGSVSGGPLTATWSASAVQASYVPDDTAAFDYIDASDGTALVTTGGFNHGRSASLQMPFAFDFFGTRTDRLCVGRNGAIEVGSQACAVPQSYTIPSTYLNAVIAPIWTSFQQESGTIYSKTVGTPGARRFVVEWKDFALDWPALPGFTFEAVIDEASGAITFQYLSTGDGSSGSAGSGAVSGLQASTSSGLMFSQFQPVLTAGKAIRWTPTAQPALSTSASIAIDIGAPQLLLPIPAMTAFAATGVSVTQPIVIGNTGNRALQWSAGEYPAAVLPRPLPLPAARASDLGLARAGRDPAAPARLGPLQRPAQALGDWVLPSYAMHVSDGSGVPYVHFDIANTANMYTVRADSQAFALENISGGDFAGDDFHQQYMIDSLYDRLYRFDTLTGAATLIGWPIAANTLGVEYWSGAAWDPVGQRLYAVTTLSNGSSGCYWGGLYTIDTVTAQASFVGPVASGSQACLIDIAFDRNGNLFGLDIKQDVLLAIDKHSGSASSIGALGVNANFAQSIKFDRASGTLYWLGYANSVGFVATIDPLTAQPTVIGSTPGNRQMAVLTIAKAGGDCSQPLDAPWLTLSTPGGSIEPGGPVGVYPVTFDATALPAGDYTASICIFSNDPAYRTRPAVVPVHFNVQAVDALFADGFD